MIKDGNKRITFTATQQTLDDLKYLHETAYRNCTTTEIIRKALANEALWVMINQESAK